MIQFMSPMALFDHLRVAGLPSSSREVRTGQESNFAIVKFFHERTGPNFYHLLYDPNTGFRYIFGQCRVGVFEKNPLLHTPISAEKRNQSCYQRRALMHKQISSELFPKVYRLCCTSFQQKYSICKQNDRRNKPSEQLQQFLSQQFLAQSASRPLPIATDNIAVSVVVNIE